MALLHSCSAWLYASIHVALLSKSTKEKLGNRCLYAGTRVALLVKWKKNLEPAWLVKSKFVIEKLWNRRLYTGTHEALLVKSEYMIEKFGNRWLDVGPYLIYLALHIKYIFMKKNVRESLALCRHSCNALIKYKSMKKKFGKLEPLVLSRYSRIASRQIFIHEWNCLTRKTISLKGFRFFSWISVPQAHKYSNRAVLNFFENSRRYSQINVYCRCKRHRR